jgi:glyoxylase-like metal-dependent hydrolase (beta-lactamase superfamily II)
MLSLKNYGNGIYAFDSGYIRPGLDAIHMVVEGDQVAFVDTGVASSLPNALEALKMLGLGVDAVAYVMLTHVHLDHAGGAGTMMRQFPRAKLVVHPRGARHMADPSKLIAGASAVYGAEYVKKVYGDIAPIPVERIMEAHDGDTVSLGGRTLTCIETPGHALHHQCIIDETSGGVFTGDTFGLSYGELDVGAAQFVFPTTTPVQFDPDAMRHSVERILDLAPEALYLTHYGQLRDVFKAGSNLLRRLDAMVDLANREHLADGKRPERLQRSITDYLFDEARAHGCRISDAVLQALLETDIVLNVQGLVYWLDHRKTN